jgi:hypothetical protein
LKIIAWVGSGGAGLSFICSHMVTPMISGHTPRCRNEPITGTTVGSQNQSKQVEHRGRVLRRES